MATGAFADIILTETGRNMVVRSQNGEELAFKHVILSDGLLNGRDPTKLTNVLGNNQLKIDVRKVINKGDGQYQVQFILSNQEVEEGFWHREIGLFAQIGNEQPKLYAYTNAGSNAAFMHDKNTPVDERRINLDFVVGNAENLTVIINSSILYATLEDLEEHNDSEDAHEVLFKTAENDADATDSSKKGASTSWVKNAFVKFKNFTSNQIKDFASAVKSLFNSSEFDDNVLRALRDKTLSTLGVRWSFSNPNSWYICLGVLFGGLIIQGVYTTFKTSTTINPPIAFNTSLGAFMTRNANTADSLASVDSIGRTSIKLVNNNVNNQTSWWLFLVCKV